jgi:hypothetical protein
MPLPVSPAPKTAPTVAQAELWWWASLSLWASLQRSTHSSSLPSTDGHTAHVSYDPMLQEATPSLLALYSSLSRCQLRLTFYLRHHRWRVPLGTLLSRRRRLGLARWQLALVPALPHWRLRLGATSTSPTKQVTQSRRPRTAWKLSCRASPSRLQRPFSRRQPRRTKTPGRQRDQLLGIVAGWL